jgi:toxin ParE1/3/4
VKALKIVFSDAAVSDILEQMDWYAEMGGHDLAKRWNESVTSTLLRIAGAPGIGARCLFRAKDLRGTRRLVVIGFPKHLIFYKAGKTHILVLRVVHGARDLESLFSDHKHSEP